MRPRNLLLPLLAACGTNAELDKRLAALEADNIRLRAELAEAPRALPVQQAAMGISRAQAEAFIDQRIALALADHATRVDVMTVNQRVAAHEAATQDLRELVVADVAARTVTIEAANLLVVSGEGTTDADTNGLGNLVVGYLEHTLEGSHNLLVGTGHQVDGYGAVALGEGVAVGDLAVGVSAASVDVESAEGLALSATVLTATAPDMLLNASETLDLRGQEDLWLDGEEVLLSGTNISATADAGLDLSGSAGASLSSGAVLDLQGALITLN